ncbi:hypothetical protein PHMEG_0008028 [Phytophthora megakarya]|uniref:DUF4219 domain-containing protein n=1 Tax=Phytophthora megakarya TaxID=4795 RepID=A0A225WLR4_9STRA|nr:hypothetical protein PHMEG_0008028 [Phytophthora megakarya]
MVVEKKKMELKEEKRSPFDGENFEMWLERISLKLKRKEPNTPNEYKKWKMEREYAKEILFDGMTNKTMKTVKYEETPFRVMEHLKKRYIGKTYFKYSEEMTKLRELRLDPKSNILDHLGEVQRLMDRMATLGKQLDEYMKPAKLIGTLPREYDNIVETFLASRTPQDLNDPPNYELLEHALKTARIMLLVEEAVVAEVGEDEVNVDVEMKDVVLETEMMAITTTIVRKVVDVITAMYRDIIFTIART